MLTEEARDIRECSDALYAEFANGRLPLDEFLAHARGERLTREEAEANREPCDHPADRLQLWEDGYTRSWGTQVDHEAKTIRATFHGSEDFDDDGDGEYLHCHACGADLPVHDDYELIWD